MARISATVPSRGFKTPCSHCPLRALKSFREFTAEELRFVEGFKTGEVHLTAGETALVEDEPSSNLYTVLSGWLVKYKMLEDGRRQIVNYALPGDFLGLQAAMLGKMQHGVEALSEATLCVFPRQKLWTLFEHHQGLGFDVTWMAAQEKAILADFLVSAGRRTATERIAFLLLSLFRRARLVGMVHRQSVSFPFTQEHFADTIGFSLVHTNKSLARLKRTGAFEWMGETFTMIDEESLAEIAGRPSIAPGPKPFI